MRRVFLAIFVLMFLFSGSVVFASNDIKVIIDGEKQSYDNDQPPVMKNNRTLVPLRGIFESLGAEIKWYSDTQTVEAIKGNTAVVLQIGSNIAYVNGEQVILDQSAEIINGRTMVQLRFVSEALGADVKWEGATDSVIITSNDEETIQTEEYINNIHAYRDNLNLINYALKGDYNQVKKLLDSGTDVNAGIFEIGYTPLMGASEYGNLSIIELLIEYGAEASLKDLDGKTAMDYAVANGHNNVIEFLKEMGVADNNDSSTETNIDYQSLSSYSVNKNITDTGYIEIRGDIPSDEIKWVMYEVINNDTNQSQNVAYPVKNNSITNEIFLTYGAGSYTINIYESKIEDKYNSEYFEVDTINVASNFDSGVYISLAETDNGIVNINGIIDPQNKWVWFLIEKNGTNEEKDVVIPVENNQFSKDLYLSMGPGEYTINVYENTEEYGYYTLNTKFNVTNLDTRDPHLLPSERIESEDPRIVELANEITEGYESDIAKSRAIYDWVIKNIKYDATSYFDGKDVSHSALEVLQLGTTDCDGYARLTAALHRAVGIEAKVVIGDTTGYGRPFDNIVDHAWNEVFIDGEWIIVDPTWGAGYLNSRVGVFVSSITFDYYDPSDEFFAKNHRKLGELYE